MTLIQQARYDALLRRVADLKGQGSMVHDALGELFPTIDVENVPGELLFLTGTRLGMAGTTLAPSVGDIPKIQLFNPEGSGKLVTVTTITLSATVSVTFELFLTAVAIGASAGNNAVRDTRAPPGSSATTEIRTLLDASGIATFWVVNAQDIAPVTITDPNGVCVLAPGTGITTAPQQTNVFHFASFFWRERIAEPSELNF